MNRELPEPTASEFETLELHIVDWRDRTPVQQAVCLAILRGRCYVPKIAEYLGVSSDMVEQAVQDLMGQGLLRDHHKLLIH